MKPTLALLLFLVGIVCRTCSAVPVEPVVEQRAREDARSIDQETPESPDAGHSGHSGHSHTGHDHQQEPHQPDDVDEAVAAAVGQHSKPHHRGYLSTFQYYLGLLDKAATFGIPYIGPLFG